jgi:hypothetical protein
VQLNPYQEDNDAINVYYIIDNISVMCLRGLLYHKKFNDGLKKHNLLTKDTVNRNYGVRWLVRGRQVDNVGSWAGEDMVK